MNRWRFWAAQGVWFVAAVITAAFATEVRFDSSMIPAGMFTVFLGFILNGLLLKWGENTAENSVNSHIFLRLVATGFFFLSYIGAVLFSVAELGGLGILIALILMFPLIIISGLIWAWERISGNRTAHLEPPQAQGQSEKRKRDRLDTVLRDLSNEDLMRLRQRLLDGDVNDELLYRRMVGDDGELLYEER